MNNRKYPTDLFILGIITNIIFRFFWLFFPSLILLIIGAFSKNCLYIGLGLLAGDILLSLFEQLQIRKTFLEDSDNPDFNAFQDALSKDGDWKQNLRTFLGEKMSDEENKDDKDTKNND